MSKHLGAPALLEVGSSDIDQIDPPLPQEVRSRLVQAIAFFLNNTLSYEDAKKMFIQATGSSGIIDKLKEITDVSDDPQNYKNHLLNSPSDDQDMFDFDQSSGPKKTKPWSPSEDILLLAGIYKYGLDNWSNVASFVGNGRTRSQASQRWSRGLNPRISKDAWSTEEDQTLIKLVQEFGDKAWTKISSLMGNRSDVQCRYHFNQISKVNSSLYNGIPCFQYQDPTIQYGQYPGSTPALTPNKISQGNKQNRTISPQFYGTSNYQQPNTPPVFSNQALIQSHNFMDRGSIFSKLPPPYGGYPSSSSTDSDPISSPTEKDHASRFLAEQRVASELRSANATLLSSISNNRFSRGRKPTEQKLVPQNVPRSQPIPRIHFAGPQDLQSSTFHHTQYMMNQNDLLCDMNNAQPQSQPQQMKKVLNNSYQNQDPSPYTSPMLEQNSSPPPPAAEDNQNPFSIDNFLRRFRH